MESFEGRRVLVVGGGGGLGYEVVKAFYKSGAIVYALDIHKERLEKLQKELPLVKIVVADITKWNEVREIVRDLGAFEHLVNVAGIHIPGTSLTTTEEMFDKIFAVNVKSVLNMSQVFAENVIANDIKDATIVSISSAVARKVVTIAGLAYSSSKTALNMMNQHLAVDLARYGIRVNCVEPTLMNTYLVDAMTPEIREAAIKSTERAPIPGLMEPVEAANLVLFLSGKYSKMITGSCVPVDGGIHIV